MGEHSIIGEVTESGDLIYSIEKTEVPNADSSENNISLADKQLIYCATEGDDGGQLFIVYENGEKFCVSSGAGLTLQSSELL